MKTKNLFRQPFLVFGMIFLVTTILLVGTLVYQVINFTTDTSKSVQNQVTEEQQDNYTLREDATEYQKTLFNELEEAKEAYDQMKDDETTLEYAEAIVKNFIADFYTWSNKSGRSDVGGVQFISKSNQATFKKQAIDGFYLNLDYYLNEYEGTDLQTVKEVEILDQDLNYQVILEKEVEVDDVTEVEEEQIDAISIHASWSYNNSKFDEIDLFQNEAVFILTSSDDKLVISEILESPDTTVE